MTVVIDASVVVKWILDEEGQDAAIALRAQSLVAPSLWLIEAANVLWRRARLGHITSLEAEDFLAQLSTAPITTVPSDRDLPHALNLANELRHPIYDCLYLATALRENAHVVTADKRFVSALAHRTDLANRVRLLTVA